MPDHRFGEQVGVWIKLKDGEMADADEIRAFCHGQIAHYKIPHYVRFVESFPMTVTGKIQKFVMREAMVAELGIELVTTA